MAGGVTLFLQMYGEYSMKKIANVGHRPVRDGKADFCVKYSDF